MRHFCSLSPKSTSDASKQRREPASLRARCTLTDFDKNAGCASRDSARAPSQEAVREAAAMAAATAAIIARGVSSKSRWDVDVTLETPFHRRRRRPTAQTRSLSLARPDVIERAVTKQTIRLRAAELEEASKRHVSELRRAHRSFRAVVAENHLLRDAAEKAEARAGEEARRASLRLKQETAPLARELRELRLERDVLQTGLDSMEQSVAPLRVEILSLQALAAAADERVREVTRRLLASRERERQETRTILTSLCECEEQLQAALSLAAERGRAESRARGRATQQAAAAAAYAQELQRLQGDVSDVGSGVRAMREQLDERLNARLASSRERELELERTVHLALADKREMQRRANVDRRLLAQELASAEQAGAHTARELALGSRRQALSAARGAVDGVAMGEGSLSGGRVVAALHGALSEQILAAARRARAAPEQRV